MKTKNRVLSLFLAMLMLVMSLPLTVLQVSAADETIPRAVSMSPIDGYSTTEVTLRGKITANGGSEIKRYGFQYGIVGGSKSETKEWSGHLTTGKEVEFELTGLQPNTTIWYYFYAVNSTGTAKDASDRDEKVNGTQYASTLPEIELDKPEINAPDVDDTFFAGDDITFEWGSVSGAEEFEWELYKGMKGMGGVLIDSGTTGTSSSKRKVKIDGDVFKANSDYNFYVWAVSGNATSSYDEVNIFIVAKPEELYVAPEELSFDAEGGEDYFDLTSSHDWEASISVSWIDLSAYEGAGDEEITVYVDENTGEQRTGFITIESDIGSIIVTIHQHSGITPYLTVSTTYIELPAEDGGWTFEISSNVGWEIFCDTDWIRNISQEAGYGDERIQILADENTSTQSRTAIITIEGDGITRTVTVTQDGRPAIVGDINNDGEITNKDRFLLNRYLANMAGYTNIDKTLADINGDGIVDQADADYLTNHLAGIKGYESFPQRDAPCLHTNCDAIYAGKTVFVNNTIKNDGVHSYYHMWRYVCKECGEDLGEFQGDNEAVKGASEKNIACSYNSDGVCSCGAIDTTEYSSWTAKNITDKQISVYDTPYSTDGSYGKVFVNESVKVLGSKAGRYLIEYTVTSTNAKKQGYVNANLLASASNYRLEFEFESITLPVSGRTVLLIPKNGSAFYHLYDGTTTIWQTNLLDNLTIQFENSGSVQDDGYTTLTGKVGGFGTMSAYYIENGNKIYLQTPDYYIVADSSEIYTSGNINDFSDEEKEYISTALDLYFSQDDINVPYELYWSPGENFALCIEELDDILAALLKDGSATENDYAAILAEFLEQYVDAEEANKTVDEMDASLGETVVSILEGLKLVAVDGSGTSSDLLNMIKSVNNLYAAKNILPSELKELFVNLVGILKHQDFKDVVRATPALQKAMDNAIIKGMTPTQLSSKISQWTNNKFFKQGGIADTIGKAGNVISIGSNMVSFAATTFGNYQRHSEFLSMMLTAIESIPVENRGENYETLKRAIELLIDRYDQEFLNKLESNMQVLAADTIVWGTKLLIAYACPGATAVVSVAQFFVQFGNAREEANVIRMRQFYLALNQGILNEFESLYNNGQTFSSIYSMVSDTVKLFLNMAIYTNDLTQDVSEYTEADKAVYKKNIEKIKNKFAIYLD